MTTAPCRLEAAVTCVWPVRAILGEGPCWDARLQRLLFLDIKGRRIYALEPETGRRRTWDISERICSIALPKPGWKSPASFGTNPYLCCGDAGFAWLSLEDDRPRIVPIVHPEAGLEENRFNDGKMGPDGRYWAGTLHDPETRDSGALYAFTLNGDAALLDSGYRAPNGPAFSPDGRTVYHSNSARQTIYAFNLGVDGTLYDKRIFMRFGPDEGYPDGMTTDVQGDLWIAMWNGSRIERVSALGQRLGAVALPTPRPTSCTFADDGGRVLYVTSARIGLPEDDALAGALFALIFFPSNPWRHRRRPQ